MQGQEPAGFAFEIRERVVAHCLHGLSLQEDLRAIVAPSRRGSLDQIAYKQFEISEDLIEFALLEEGIIKVQRIDPPAARRVFIKKVQEKDAVRLRLLFLDVCSLPPILIGSPVERRMPALRIF